MVDALPPVSRRTWKLPEGVGRVAGWGHYGRPVLWLGPGAPDHLEPARYGIVAALTPLMRDGRLKLYASDAPPSVWPDGVFDIILDDCGHTDQRFCVVGADVGVEAAWALASHERVGQVVLLEPPRALVPADPPETPTWTLGRPGTLPPAWSGRPCLDPGDVRAPGWDRWRSDLPHLLHAGPLS